MSKGPWSRIGKGLLLLLKKGRRMEGSARLSFMAGLYGAPEMTLPQRRQGSAYYISGAAKLLAAIRMLFLSPL